METRPACKTHERVHQPTLADAGYRVLRALERRWHYVYLARASDGSYYCGYALDPKARLAAHNSGKGSKALRGKRPVRLVFLRRFANKNAALKFELSLKRRSHEEKRTLSKRWRRTASR